MCPQGPVIDCGVYLIRCRFIETSHQALKGVESAWGSAMMRNGEEERHCEGDRKLLPHVRGLEHS